MPPFLTGGIAMADEIDIADEVAETILQAQIEQARKQEPSAIPTGFCLFCGEPVEDERRWCDSSCRDDWELERREH